MNYQTEIRMFNEWLETHELTASGIALWYAFMFTAYRSGWPTEVAIPVSALCLRSKLSRSAVYKERNMLRDYGLIDFDTTSGRQSTRYRIRSLEARYVATEMSATRTQTETGAIIPAEDTSEMSTVVSTSRTQSGEPPDAEEEMSSTKTQPWTQIPAESDAPPEMSALVSTTRTQTGDERIKAGETSTTWTRPCIQTEDSTYISISNKYRDKRGYGGKKRASVKHRDAFDLTFIAEPRWLELVKTWLDYKRSRGENYKSDLSVKKFYTMLRNLSHGDPDLAARIIDKSIANNWAGIFELPESDAATFGRETTSPLSRSGRSRPASGQRIGQIKQPVDEERRRHLLENFGRAKVMNDESKNR
jgi:hypothetical protein|nr:MAG TPA: hypothetical protein [Caudoviricetes sp.]